MKIAALVAFVVVMAAIGLLTRRNQRVSGTKTDVNVVMRDAASEAVEVAKETYEFDLDYTADSVLDVERILARIHEEQEGSPIPLDREKEEAWRWGAYIGEVILRTSPGGGHWEVDHEAGGPNSFPVVVERGASFPIFWCRSRLRNGSEDNVWAKFITLYGPNALDEPSPARSDAQ